MARLWRSLICGVLAACGTAHAELGINIYGASYHFERETARELGLTNEINPGLGLRWRRVYDGADLFVDAGFYIDSARNTATLLGGGALWHASERSRLGGGLVLLRSSTYNRGDAFLAPVPLAAYEWRRFTLNAVYFPKIHPYNATSQLGFWLTLWLP